MYTVIYILTRKLLAGKSIENPHFDRENLHNEDNQQGSLSDLD
jgi:hypothetical protein